MYYGKNFAHRLAQLVTYTYPKGAVYTYNVRVQLLSCTRTRTCTVHVLSYNKNNDYHTRVTLYTWAFLSFLSSYPNADSHYNVVLYSATGTTLFLSVNATCTRHVYVVHVYESMNTFVLSKVLSYKCTKVQRTRVVVLSYFRTKVLSKIQL
ncbi:uncharacterized protein MICPUCDRAFT_55714 [Micromonas pusilla CCMP1545]|uniref:Predicted protein n=1 Tax=Micromonas pusilla (strain CCMP1545) TaxID=564608 RepID=C1MLH3_MICPC|nr:uncharacterized protein MICPUCDRAFT_55714 [Micromonas pusilla CCMP1545]EEH59940.1 predicted protein [Micromonas pusilla CCMP1545]|eukprot:XP_003056564.1 predicted protein [Micromonas pusilla CCMP1545]